MMLPWRPLAGLPDIATSPGRRAGPGRRGLQERDDRGFVEPDLAVGEPYVRQLPGPGELGGATARVPEEAVHFAGDE